MHLNALIVSATGRRMHKVGDISHAQFRHGDYHVSIEWVSEGRECEPVMAIWSPTSMDGGVFAIALSSIAKYADPSGGPTRTAFLECWRALPTLGRAQIDIEVFKLIDVILRHTPDLIRCPPMPPAARQAEAPEPLLEVTTKIGDRKVSEVVI
ncbi:MAG TPA: hypothetical protein PLL72_14985 [Burkholderiaceae bacterium]|nr:hypothetical protein [Burkholderiaceae bacterium]